MQAALGSASSRRIFWGVVTLVGLVAVWWIVRLIPHTIAIFTIAAFIAFGVRPMVAVLVRARIPRWLAITLIFVVLVMVVVLLLLVVVPMAVLQSQLLISNMPSYAQAVHGWVVDLRDALQVRFPALQIPTIDIAQIGADRLGAVASQTLSSIGTLVINTATWLFIAFAAIVLSFYFLLNDEQISEGFAMLFPPRRRATARKVVVEVTDVFGKYIFGQIVVSAITGIVIAVVSAAIGFKYPLIIGLISAVAYAVPVIGMVIAQVIALVLCAPQGAWMMLWLQVVMFVMARISDMVLVPRIMGSTVGVSPIGVMFAVFAGGELFGMPGLILGIPAAALVKILWRYFGPWLHAASERT
ncbi:MAG TPA: AI-2E family transporter [Candidatus Dormibacteraeota bacterium]|nr:AI-2E family transporter [Candidatus Dormibacteraeota bacterium]